jgi:hypothetical protein
VAQILPGLSLAWANWKGRPCRCPVRSVCSFSWKPWMCLDQMFYWWSLFDRRGPLRTPPLGQKIGLFFDQSDLPKGHHLLRLGSLRWWRRCLTLVGKCEKCKKMSETQHLKGIPYGVCEQNRLQFLSCQLFHNAHASQLPADSRKVCESVWNCRGRLPTRIPHFTYITHFCCHEMLIFRGTYS